MMRRTMNFWASAAMGSLLAAQAASAGAVCPPGDEVKTAGGAAPSVITCRPSGATTCSTRTGSDGGTCVVVCAPGQGGTAQDCQLLCTTADGRTCRIACTPQATQGRLGGAVYLCSPGTAATAAQTGTGCATAGGGTRSTAASCCCACCSTCSGRSNTACLTVGTTPSVRLMSCSPMVSTWTSDSGAALSALPAVITSAVGLEPLKPPAQDAGAASEKASGAWLGIQLGEVSDILAAQLDVQAGQAVTVLNLVKDSPAEKAGLQRFDVITAVNGQPAKGGVPAVAETISSMKPGERVTLDVLRQGKTLKVEATLAERRADFEWKYDFAPGLTAEDSVNLHGRIIRPDKDGAWIVEELEDLDVDDMEGLPNIIQQFVPKGQSSIQKMYVDGDRRSIRIERTIDGDTLIIEQENDGAISVVRKDAQGNEKTTKYSNREELRQNDAEAADLLEGQGGVRFFVGPGGGFQFRHGGPGDPKYMEELKDKLREAEEAFNNAMKDIESEWKTRFGDGDEPAWRDHFRRFDEFFKDGGAGFGGTGLFRARHSFHVNPDGSIEVHIRKGDSEMVRTFRDEADLQKQDPKLYEKYQQMTRDE